jgi:hypothetical protein
VAARTKRVPWPVDSEPERNSLAFAKIDGKKRGGPLGQREAHPLRRQDWQGIFLSHFILSLRHSAQET